jgi:hypothetical protein
MERGGERTVPLAGWDRPSRVKKQIPASLRMAGTCRKDPTKTVQGRVISVEGKPIAGLEIKANSAQAKERKATLTGPQGKFALRGLPDARCTLVAHAKALRQKTRQVLTLDRDLDSLVLRLTTLQTNLAAPPVEVLGLQLADMDQTLKERYDLTDARGVVVLASGAASERLNMGTLREGDCLWIVGETAVGSVRELVEELLRNAVRTPGKGAVCRVVYSFRRVDFAGTNTQHMELTAENLEELEQLLSRLRASEPKAR